MEPSPRGARSLQAQAARYGARAERVSEGADWVLSKGDNAIVLTEKSRFVLVNGIQVYLDSPLQARKGGRSVLSKSDESLLLPTVFDGGASVASPVETIVIDPGHGGLEDGAKNEPLGLLEKEMNLDVAKRLQAHLESLGFETVLTRYDDRLVPLKERPAIANSAKADLFVSVHFNGSLEPEANGLETYMLTPEDQSSTAGSEPGDDLSFLPGNRFDRENFTFAFAVQREMVERLGLADRGVRKARFAVLKTLDCPGILVEGGFLSNDEEALLVSTAGYRERLALALAESIASYARGEPVFP